MIPKHIFEAIINSPAGKLIDRLIIEERARGGDTSTPGGQGSLVSQIYETVKRAQTGQKWPTKLSPPESGPTRFDCIECGKNSADFPSQYCPGCEAYLAHQR
jgi:hypothetical protein